MKYLIASLLFLVICIAAGWTASRLISQKAGDRKYNKAVMAAVISTALIAAGSFAYLEVYYHADPSAEEYLKSSDTVEVSRAKKYWRFDGPGDERAIVFFPGAKVEETAYAPLMFRLAERGVDCFLLRVPFRIAMMDADAPDDLIGKYGYENWFMMGHSLGGIAAARYCSDNPEAVDGVILLAAYAATAIPDTEKLISIYGTNDGCLEMAEYGVKKRNWPVSHSEVVIEGGNHAGFGNYGKQAGDGMPEISADEQQRQTEEAVFSWIHEIYRH